ncbi:Non-specific lipid-transfer protein-like protein [Striga hermonthica]|uniref:Non-specific lipid-transfer protein-like protein n=1 Tax=Striga hermonthica TaxID=68872 RepID=A0A9N7R0V6_STRHE|nr:Non-specific lipid-transfer protein-like protein [Striga hermonthica]
MTKALALPAACHVSAPAASNCAVSTAIGAAPAEPPVAAVSPSAVAGAPTAGIGATEGGAPAIAPASGNSASSAATVSIEMLVFGTLAALFYGIF